MSTPFLATKLYIPPVRPELVPRPRLIARLNAGMVHKLTLLSAPAGYGKTTLLNQWIHQGGDGAVPALPVAWLSLDETDNDPNRFLYYLVSAARAVVPQIGEGLMSLLRSSQSPSVESVLSSLVNDLAAIPCASGQCCLLGLVLDDYHLIENQEIHRAVAFLLEQLPPPPQGMHLVIATRKDPLLPLPRWRAGALMNEVREKDLRFTLEEATHFLKRVMGLSLSMDEVAIVEDRTEGWIAGLQLAALSMQGLGAARTARFIAAFSGDDRHVVDYLVDEVLDQRPTGTKSFLLQTSILERMSGPLCDAVCFGDAETAGGSETMAVTGGQDGQHLLETLEQANLFVVPLDNRRQWYRYHHLFAQVLQHRLQAMAGPEMKRSLHLRASEWFGNNGYLSEAVHHAIAAGDLTRAADLIEHNARDMFARSELKMLMTWVDALPEDLVLTRPWLSTFCAWALRLTGGQADAVDARLQIAEQALENSKAVLPEDDVRTIRGHIGGIRAYQALYREEIPRVIDLARQALDRLPDTTFARGLTASALGWALRFSGDLAGASQAFVEARAASLASGNTYTAATAICRLAYTEMLGGRLRQGARIYQEALELAIGVDGQYLPVAGYALVYLGMLCLEWNDLEAAARHLEDGIGFCRQVGFLFDQVVGYSALARVRHAEQDWDSTQSALQSAERSSLKMKGYVLAQRWVEDCQIRLWSAQGRLSEVARWMQETDLSADDDVSFVRELEHIILARALVAVGREQPGEPYLDDALVLLARLLEAAESAGWVGKAIEILALQALAFQAKGHTEKALKALEHALGLAEPEGYVRTFVDEGASMARLLRQAARSHIAPGYVRRLLAAFRYETGDDGFARSMGAAPPPALVDPLTERELQVLRLIAGGLSNREIADRLFLALSTVKVHTRNIYGKLGVNSRTKAGAKAQQLHLL